MNVSSNRRMLLRISFALCLKEIFNLSNISEPVRWLSQSGSAFCFKKRKDGINGAIENKEFPAMWMGNYLNP